MGRGGGRDERGETGRARPAIVSIELSEGRNKPEQGWWVRQVGWLTGLVAWITTKIANFTWLDVRTG